MRSKRISQLLAVFIFLMLVALMSFIGFTVDFASAETGNPLDLEGTNLNGAVLLDDTTKHIPVKSYITKLDKGYNVSTGTESFALLKNGAGTPYVNFFVDTLGAGGSVYKGASRYHGYNAYGFVAGEGEDIYRHDEEKNEDVLIGKQAVAIKLNYNFNTTKKLKGTDGKTWDICNDSWKASVNGISGVGVVGKGAVIVQKFVPSDEKLYPSEKDDWMRLNEYSGLETAGIHTVNFFDEFAPSYDKSVTVYSPLGKDLQKGVFIKITVAYELVHTDISYGWFGNEKRTKTYKNVVEETAFYLCNTSAEVVFNNLYCGDSTTGEDVEKPEKGENSVEKHGGVISNNQGAIEGFRADINGWNYNVTYRVNNSSNTFICDDGQVFVEPGRYDFTIKSKLGIVRHKTVYIHEKSQDENIRVYFGDGLVSKNSKRVFDPSETYPVYVKGSVTLQTPNENASFVKHAPLIGKVFLIDGDWNEIDRDSGIPTKTVVAEKTATNHAWSFSDLPAGKYEAVFFNNEEYFSGTATGDTYKFVWRFSVIEEGLSPTVNETLLYQQLGVGDYASLHYIAPLPAAEGAGSVCVVFADEESAYHFECRYLASTVKVNGKQFVFDGKEYSSESVMLLDLHAKAHSLVRKHYFDATDASTYVTVRSDNIKPVLGDNPSESDEKQYQKLLEEYTPILSQKFNKDIYIFTDEVDRENFAIGTPFLNDRLYAYIDEKGEIQKENKPLYFLQVADFESSSIELSIDGTKVSFPIPYGVAVQEYLVGKCAPSGHYRIVESNAYGTTEYFANYIRPGDMASSLTIERLYYNNYVKQTLSKANDGLRLRANWFKISDISNDLDPYGIIKIKLPDNETLIYQIDEYEKIPEFNEVGNYEIVLVDRLGNFETFYVDIFTSETVYTVTLMDGENIIKSEVAYGGKNIILDQLSSQNCKYVFYGWQDEEGNIYRDKYVFNKPQNVLLKAVWHYHSVAVEIYDGSKIGEFTGTVGSTLQLPKLQKDGFRLYGYRYVLEDGTYRFYRGQINNILNVESMRLDAVWQKAEPSSFNIAVGSGETVAATLVDGEVIKTISFQKDEAVQLPNVENQLDMVFLGWAYEYRLNGIVFTDRMTYDEIKEIGLLNSNSIKLVAVYTTSEQQDTDSEINATVSGTINGGSIAPMSGIHINSKAVKNIVSAFGAVLFAALLALMFAFRKKIINFITKHVASYELSLRQRECVVSSCTETKKSTTKNYMVAKKQPFMQNVKQRLGYFVATINKKTAYKKLFFPIIIIFLCFVLLFASHYDVVYLTVNSGKAFAETTTAGYAEEYNNGLDAKNEFVPQSDNSTDEISSTEERDLEFLYKNIVVDLIAFGYEDVFAAYAIVGNKRVDGIGYTAYVDAYGDENEHIFGAGFVSIAGENCLTSDDVKNEVKIYVSDEEAYNYEYTEFKLTANETWGPYHYVAYNKYVQYSVANYLIQPIISNDTGEYNDSLGDVYSYDLGDYCHYVNYDQEFDFDAYGITADMDYDKILQTYKELIEEQIRSSVSVEVEQADFISVQALNDYIAHDQDERFLGVEAEALMCYEANITDNQYYIVYENGEVGVLELPPDPEKKATIWERIWMGLASAAGAVIGVVACAIPGVGPVLGGAMISASLDLFMQVTVSGASPDNIDWGSVMVSAVVGGLTGGIGQGFNALTKGAVEAAKTVFRKALIKLGTQVAAGVLGGTVTYVANMFARGEEFSLKEFAKAVGLGAATGAIACIGGVAIEKIAEKSNALYIALQIVSGSIVSAAGYLLSIKITGQEFSWTDFAIATAMGAATSTIMVFGGKIVKTIKTAQAKRAEKQTKLSELDINDTNIQKQSIEEKLSSKEGLDEIMAAHPDKAEKWRKTLAEVEDLLESGSSKDVKRARLKLNNVKGEIFEYAARDTFTQNGLTVEIGQSTVQGESGKTRPDIIARNNTNKPINVFGTEIAPGETVYVECKCGQKPYLAKQLRANGRLRNQLSGHVGGKSILLSTSNLNQVNEFIKMDVVGKYNTTLVPANISGEDVQDLLLKYAGVN